MRDFHSVFIFQIQISFSRNPNFIFNHTPQLVLISFSLYEGRIACTISLPMSDKLFVLAMAFNRYSGCALLNMAFTSTLYQRYMASPIGIIEALIRGQN
jgi:hypothetical protein